MVCDDVLDEGQRSSSSLEAAGTGGAGPLIALTNECYKSVANFPALCVCSCVCVWSMLLWL